MPEETSSRLAASLGGAAVARAAMAALPEAPARRSPATQPPLVPKDGRPYNPVVTLNGWTLPWRMNNGWKEFHLVAEPVVRELAPGMKAHLWGYNGQSPGPTLECVRGRQAAHLRDQPPAGAHDGALARRASCPTAWTAWAGSRNRRSPWARRSSTSSR